MYKTCLKSWRTKIITFRRSLAGDHPQSKTEAGPEVECCRIKIRLGGTSLRRYCDELSKGKLKRSIRNFLVRETLTRLED